MIEQDLWSAVFLHFTKVSVANRENIVPDAAKLADASVAAFRAAFPAAEKVEATTEPKRGPGRPPKEKTE